MLHVDGDIMCVLSNLFYLDTTSRMWSTFLFLSLALKCKTTRYVRK